MSTYQNLALFIFQSPPPDDYWLSIQNFIHVSLRIPTYHILKYDYASHSKNSTLQYLNIADDPAILFVDMMKRMLDDLRNVRNIHFDTTIVYVDNTALSANRSDVSHDVFWYRFFDVIKTEHILYLYRDAVFFEMPLFTNKAVYYADRIEPTHMEILIETTNVDMSCSSRQIVVDNINLTEFCDSILAFAKGDAPTMDILQYVIRQTGIVKSVLYTNFTLLSTVCFMVRNDALMNTNTDETPLIHRYFILTVYASDDDNDTSDTSDSDTTTSDTSEDDVWKEDGELGIYFRKQTRSAGSVLEKPAESVRTKSAPAESVLEKPAESSVRINTKSAPATIRYLEQCYHNIHNYQRNRYFAEC